MVIIFWDESDNEFSYILRVKILKDYFRRLLSLSWEQYIIKVLKWFNIQDFKLINISIFKGKFLNHRLYPKTTEERAQTKKFYILVWSGV